MSGSARVSTSAPYGATVADFHRAEPDAVLGTLVKSHQFASLDQQQIRAWDGELVILREALQGVEGWLFLEFDVPRLGSRIDTVLVCGAAVLPLEFKVGETRYTVDGINQVWDYALDLKNFHHASHEAGIFPILIATDATDADLAVDSEYAAADALRSLGSTAHVTEDDRLHLASSMRSFRRALGIPTVS